MTKVSTISDATANKSRAILAEATTGCGALGAGTNQKTRESRKSIRLDLTMMMLTVFFAIASLYAVAQTTVNLATVSASGTGYTWANPVLVVNNGANLIITTNGTSTTRRIDVAKNATASITLNNCIISMGNCAIWLDSGANVTLTLVGQR